MNRTYRVYQRFWPAYITLHIFANETMLKSYIHSVWLKKMHRSATNVSWKQMWQQGFNSESSKKKNLGLFFVPQPIELTMPGNK